MKKPWHWYITAYLILPLQWLIAHTWIFYFRVFKHMTDEQARVRVLKMIEENEWL